MTDTILATEVFTPGDFPRHTYVDRDDERLERRLRDALSTPGEIVSLSGPSKSGKTVLVERIVGENLIPITGAGIRSAEDVWNRVLDWMGAPNQVSEQNAKTGSGTIDAKAKAGASFFGLAKGEVEGGGSVTSGHSRGRVEVHDRRGLDQVIQEIAKSDFVVLLDDFHYMDHEVQVEVAKEIKEAGRQIVNICTASVPHRSDDVVRSNPELRGRVRAIDTGYWSTAELKKIAGLGFPRLGLKIDDQWIARMATESSGSPQLMQALCLHSCFELGVRESVHPPQDHVISAQQQDAILEETSTTADFSALVTALHRGARTRGVERKEYKFADGSLGDNYRCALLAIASDPPRLSFAPEEMANRIARVCAGASPKPATIGQACAQLDRIARGHPAERVLDWDSDQDILDIVDPYFLFYLRGSRKLESLGRG